MPASPMITNANERIAITHPIRPPKAALAKVRESKY
jgi:hypothetical protein